VTPEPDPAADNGVDCARRGGQKGGKVKAEKLTPEERKAYLTAVAGAARKG
jgi:hypothetical protein